MKLKRMGTVGLIAAGLLLLFAAGAAIQGLGTSPGVDPTAVKLGSVDDFPIGVPVEFEIETTTVDLIPPEANRVNGPNPDPTPSLRGFVALFVVKQPDGSLLALYQRSPWLGCRVTAIASRDEFDLPGIPADFSGGFVDVCHGGVYGLDGAHLGGPGERGLDRFEVTLEPDGTVFANLSRVRPGPVG